MSTDEQKLNHLQNSSLFDQQKCNNPKKTNTGLFKTKPTYYFVFICAAFLWDGDQFKKLIEDHCVKYFKRFKIHLYRLTKSINSFKNLKQKSL